MASSVEFGVAVPEDEFADEYVVFRTHDRLEAFGALNWTRFARRYPVQRTADGWVEAL
ncbi:hypothetical protein [Streptomyces sp. CAU 1734]|uniref:hypothetical protein n=1 Tax=Streptomyces sp. CAU 1734 TaxID=3140360 RepID=UPI003261B090